MYSRRTMYRHNFLKILLIFSSLFISGCSQNSFLMKTKTNLFNRESPDSYITETMEVAISCNKDNIESYIEKGWEITSSYEEDVACTWKTSKASKRCNPKKDKGCLITVPDVMGKKTIYTLNKQIKIDKTK